MRDDATAALRRTIGSSFGFEDSTTAASRSLHDELERFTRPDSDLLLILDQFDEYFLYHPDDEDPFVDDLAAVVNDETLGVNVLLSVREDALASLDRFKGRIPQLFSNYLRLEHLRPDARERRSSSRLLRTTVSSDRTQGSTSNPSSSTR